MSSTTHNPIVLLKRIFSLKEQSSMVLCTDTIGQSSEYLIEEFVFNIKESDIPIVYLAFEHLTKPAYASQFIDCTGLNVKQIIDVFHKFLPKCEQDQAGKRCLVIVDSINYIPKELLIEFVCAIASNHVTLVVTYHKSMPSYRDPSLQHYPGPLQLLQFIANTILDTEPACKSIDQEYLESELHKFVIPRNLNSHVYNLTLRNRRRSGRTLSYSFQINNQTHDYRLLSDHKDHEDDSEDVLLRVNGLTTFNLGTTKRQRLAKEQVDLPFLEAQSFNSGGAIVYEFEKDDDYDEEDPYEDPF
ncbi:Elongator subunit IKI1 Ecym_5086 [Eremothecium cymbalariae DBVPG|uniref:Elongator complex protein 5 n=1 Tax=Eremothecium cymbalariae (strain CBS 270.75 / DBVPG 7215 / KCTC 17166 / NRRL Y-17582) TaxID=931890 RepID=I6NCT2_ERECY|nr:hypothetical protein Ecym_5086 [Eremothecium cymbalariae DBVPG\